MTALCSGSCRPDAHGGPRQTMHGSHLCVICADRLRENLETIADTWADLDAQLGHETSHDHGDRITGSPTRGLIINERVSELEREITSWAHFLARVVIDERQLSAGPRDQSTPGLLRWLADWHGDFLAMHHDAGLVEDMSANAFDFAREARRVAYPSGAHRLDLPGMGCIDFVENAAGERLKCEGTMFVVVVPDAPMPDLICTFDRHHRVEPAVWRRAAWRSKLDPVAIAAFIGHVSA